MLNEYQLKYKKTTKQSKIFPYSQKDIKTCKAHYAKPKLPLKII